MNINVKVNPVYLKHLNKHHFVQIYYGGSSSGKSYFLAQKIVLDNINGVNWLCCRNVAKTIRNSTFNEITKAIYKMELARYYNINKSDMVITCKLNGKQILFAGLDDAEKIKSVTPANGVLERIFIEEATEIKYDAYKQLTKRLRGETEHSKCVILAFNPILKTHWIYSEFFKFWENSKNYYESNEYGKTDKAKGYSLSILKTTYKDNLFLTDDDRELLENESDPYYYQVYSLGNFGVLGHVIFKNWHVEDLSGIIPTFDKIYCGMDFGWNDPTAMIKIHLDKNRKKIYVFDEVYQQHMTDEVLLKKSKEFFGKKYVMCDSAEPKTIDFLSMNGINAIPTVKGSDSIMRGIRFLQGYEIIIDVHCQNFKNEIEQYHFMEDKYGNAIEKPCDENNHLIDALRYAIENETMSSETMATIRI